MDLLVSNLVGVLARGLLFTSLSLLGGTALGQAPDAWDAYAEHVTQVIAHRGASKERPECTLAAISRAIDVGATAVEVDVRQSRDKKLFILHDSTLQRTTNGKGEAAALSLEELKELDAGSWFAPEYKHQKIPTLAEVLRLCRGKIDVLLDLKIEGKDFANRVAEQVDRFGDQEQTIIGVRTVEHAAYFRKRLPKVRQLGLIPDQKSIEAFGAAGVEMIRLWPKWLGDEEEARELLKRVRTIGCKLHVNGREGTLREVRELLVFRPDSISSDDPNALQRTLRLLRASRKSADSLEKVIRLKSNVPWLASRSNKGELSFLNREYVFLELPEGLAKTPRFLFDGGEGESIRLQAVEDVVVFAVFQYNDTGDWTFADGQTPEGHGWKKWGKSVFRGSSNGTLKGKPHHAPIYARSVKKGETLAQMPPWWLCLGIARKSELKEVGIDWESFRNPVFDLPYSFSRWAIGVRPIRAPLNDKETFQKWQQGQRERFERSLVFPLRSKVQFKGPIQTQDVESVRHDEYKAFALDKLGNRRTLFRFFHLSNQKQSNAGEHERRATVVFFMGHGKVSQLLTDADSYQHAAAQRFAKLDYEVFVMENVGMGPTADSHLQIDRVLRLDGYSWYSVLFAHQRLLLGHVFEHPSVDPNRVGVAGVSTGGLLALSAGAIEPRVAAMSVQGIFGDMRYHFIRKRHKHCQCGAIPGLLGDFNLPQMMLMATPTPIQVCNSSGDSFDPAHAAQTLNRLKPYFEKLKLREPDFRSPGGSHEFQVELALDFFEKHLRSPQSER